MNTEQPYEGLGDDDLVRHTLNGRPECFEPLFERYERAVYGYLFKMTRIPEDAEDLTQETFLKAYRGLASYRLDQPFGPWLFRIATNTARSAKRRKRPLTISIDDATQAALAKSGGAHPGEELDRRVRMERLGQAIAMLDPEDAVLIHLRHFEGMALKDIAVVLNRKPGAIAVALHRLRRKLREALFNPADENPKEVPNHGLRPGHANF